MFGLKAPDAYYSDHCLLKNVGVMSFNKQHLRLASYAVEFGQIVEQLSDRDPRPEDWKHIDALFSRVCLYVATHFREEEEMMTTYGYPEYPGHKSQHDEFVQNLAQVQSEINNRNIKFTGRLSSLLWDWLYRHINEVDYRYREFFHDKGLG